MLEPGQDGSFNGPDQMDRVLFRNRIEKYVGVAHNGYVFSIAEVPSQLQRHICLVYRIYVGSGLALY